MAAVHFQHLAIHFFHEQIESSKSQFFLALEMIVETTLLQPGDSHDFRDGSRLIALPVQQGRGALENSLSGLFAFTHRVIFKTNRSVIASALLRQVKQAAQDGRRRTKLCH